MYNGFTTHIYNESWANSDMLFFRESENRLLHHMDTSRTSEAIHGDAKIGLSIVDKAVVY
jgi:hypothetical protein